MRISDNHFCNLVRLSLKIPVGKGCGFVQFADRKNAEDAIQALNGTVIGKQTVRLSWVAVQWRSDSNGCHGFAETQSGTSHATCCCCNSRGFLIGLAELCVEVGWIILCDYF